MSAIVLTVSVGVNVSCDSSGYLLHAVCTSSRAVFESERGARIRRIVELLRLQPLLPLVYSQLFLPAFGQALLLLLRLPLLTTAMLLRPRLFNLRGGVVFDCLRRSVFNLP